MILVSSGATSGLWRGGSDSSKSCGSFTSPYPWTHRCGQVTSGTDDAQVSGLRKGALPLRYPCSIYIALHLPASALLMIAEALF